MTLSNAHTTPLFPADLLGKPANACLEYFHTVRVRHPRVHDTLQRLSSLATPYAGTEIALLVGPAGVGKTETIRKLVEDINLQFRPQMETNPSLLPAVWMELMAYGENFSWVAAYEQMLQELGEPLIDRKTLVYEENERKLARAASKFGSRIAALRFALEESFRTHGTQVLAMDEPVAMVRHTSGAKLASYMDTFKSMTNRTGTRFVLAGAYDIYALMMLNGQVARRTEPVHFTRYRQTVAADRHAFSLAVATLQRHLPLENPPDLVPHADSLMEGCIGCVGLLKTGLKRGLAHALSNKGQWNDEALGRVLLDKNQQNVLLQETLAGEAMMDGDMHVAKHLAGLGKKSGRARLAA